MPASIVVSAALQPAQRTKLESYISKDHPYAALIGRLQAAAFGLRVSDEFTFRLALSCVSSSACEQLVGALDAARRQARPSLEVKALGLDAWLDRVTVRRSDKSVGLQLILSADDVDAVVTRSKLVESLLESDGPSSAPAAASVAPSAGPPSPSSVKPSPP